MTMTARNWAASVALAIVIANPGGAVAQDGAKLKPGPAAERPRQGDGKPKSRATAAISPLRLPRRASRIKPSGSWSSGPRSTSASPNSKSARRKLANGWKSARRC